MLNEDLNKFLSEITAGGNTGLQAGGLGVADEPYALGLWFGNYPIGDAEGQKIYAMRVETVAGKNVIAGKRFDGPDAQIEMQIWIHETASPGSTVADPRKVQ